MIGNSTNNRKSLGREVGACAARTKRLQLYPENRKNKYTLASTRNFTCSATDTRFDGNWACRFLVQPIFATALSTNNMLSGPPMHTAYTPLAITNFFVEIKSICTYTAMCMMNQNHPFFPQAEFLAALIPSKHMEIVALYLDSNNSIHQTTKVLSHWICETS